MKPSPSSFQNLCSHSIKRILPRRRVHFTAKTQRRVFDTNFDFDRPPFRWIPEEERVNYAKVLQYYNHCIWDDKHVHQQSFVNLAVNFPSSQNPYLISPLRRFFPRANTSGGLLSQIFSYLISIPRNSIANYLLSTINVTQNDLKVGAKQAFSIIINSMVKKDLKTLRSVVAFNMDECTMVNVEDNKTMAKAIEYLKEFETVKTFDQKVESQLLCGRQKKSKVKTITKKVPYRELINCISKLNLEMRFTKDDIVFIPGELGGNLFYSVVHLPKKDGQKTDLLVVTVTVVAMYKKKALYSTIKDRPLLNKSDEVPGKSSSLYLLRAANYGHNRPLLGAALISFAFPANFHESKLTGDAQLYGFYIQLPNRDL